MNMEKAYIVIINYNGEKDTVECLDSLMKTQKGNFVIKTIIVDNYPENPIDIDEGKYKGLGLKVIFNSQNLGFSGGNNVGINYALENGADYVLLLNNDTLVKPDFLLKLFEFAKKKKDAGIIAPKIYFAKGFEFHKDRYKKEDQGKVIWYAGGILDLKNVIGRHVGVDEVDHGQYNSPGETGFASGCCMLIKKEVFEKVGFLDEKYFLYYEDSEFCLRAKKAGFKVFFTPDSIIWHKNAGSAGGSGSDIQDYYITRNRLLFGNKYAPVRSKISLIKEGLMLALKGRPMQRLGAKDYFLKRFGKSGHF